MNRASRALFAILLPLAFSSAAAAQQAPPVPPPPPSAPGVVYSSPVNARELQQELRDLMQQYPPALGEVLRLDPALLSRPDYLAPYPALVAFMQQHPEVVRNPSFFFGQRFFEQERTPQLQALNTIETILVSFWVLCGFTVAVSLLYALIRQVLEHRKWRRQVQIQTDMQNKLVDKMTTGQEMLSYLENAGGRPFMEWAALSPEVRTLAPVTRILWSAQIGLVLACVGAGLLAARGAVDTVEVMSVFEVMGTVAIAAGIGFALSAVVSWMLSVRMGLMGTSKADA